MMAFEENKMKFATLILATFMMYGCVEQEPEILAQPYNATMKCWEDKQPTGKFATQDDCNSAIYHVMDEKSQIWMLINSCGKDEFNLIGYDDMLGTQSCEANTP